MKFHVITLYPDLILNYFKFGVVGSALDKKFIEVNCINPRDFTQDVHKTVDDRPFGGGDGMVMLASVLEKSVQSVASNSVRPLVIYLSAQGEPLSESKVKDLSQHQELVLINGRYGGIDQRFLNEYVDEEISIGDYVLSGGELASLVVIDAVTRKIPGVLGHADSSEKDSFSMQYQGGLEAPLFTRPSDWKGQNVPSILKEGHHQKIEEWKTMMSQLMTLQKRPDLFKVNKEIDLEKLKKFYSQLSQDEKQVCGLKKDLF